MIGKSLDRHSDAEGHIPSPPLASLGPSQSPTASIYDLWF